ncbi:mitochondrial outer membrane protein [Coemansia spiralis]|nr:mitochondrial outer membrane protein [Coemansia spiralis]
MASYLERVSRAFSDTRVQLVTTAVAASVVTASVMWGARKFRQTKRVRKLKRDTVDMSEFDSDFDSFTKGDLSADPSEHGGNDEVVTKHTQILLTPNEESLIHEQLARHYAFLGEKGMAQVRNSFVIVVGAGGVGSWAALMLLRSGIQRIRLVDFDQVTLSSLNRHAAATRANVGIPKVAALKMNFAEVAPHAKVEARVALFGTENASELLSGEPDYVLDCIDNMDTKLELLTYCSKNNIQVISAMGAGMKSDPSRVQIADIGDTFEDPMSRAVRRRLKLLGIQSGIKVVYSMEKPGKVQLLSLAESQKDSPGDFSVLPDFRVRIVPVLGTMPAMFGIAMGTHVLTELAGFPTEPLAVKGRHALYSRLQRDLGNREQKVSPADGGPQLHMSVDDCGYMLEEIWRGKSVISGATDRLALTRWRRDKPMSTSNCVCMTKEEADEHDKLAVSPEERYSPEIIGFVDKRLTEEKHLSTMR